MVFYTGISEDVSFTPTDLVINFALDGIVTFSLTVSATDDDGFEGLHSFELSLPTDSDFISPQPNDIASTTITITDLDGKNKLPCDFVCIHVNALFSQMQLLT